MSQKKVESALKQIENALKAGVKTLNELQEGALSGSAFDEHPLSVAGSVIAQLLLAKAGYELNARYEGKTPDEVEQMQAYERQAERERLQAETQAKLNARLAKPEADPEPEPDDEPTDPPTE